MINPNTILAYKLFHDGILMLSRAEHTGIRIDVEYVQRKINHLKRKIDFAEENFYKSDFYKKWQSTVKDGKVNINSHTQLAHYLYDVLGYDPPKLTDSGKGSTDIESLLSLNIPEFTALLEKNKIKKLIDVLEGFYNEQVDGVLHTDYNLHLVTSYRSSSSSPNMQNVPKRDKESMYICRKAIYPRLGHQLLEVDFKAIEVGINCCVSGDTLIETINGSISIKNVIDKINNNENVYVYGYDHILKRIGISKITSGGITRKNAEIWKIVLDNGKEIKTTLDHKFLKRNEEYVAVKDLKKGDSLMPFYSENKKSNWGTVYKRIYLNNGKSEFAHNLIAQDIYNVKIRGSNKIVHHKNGNGCDNSLLNLEIMNRKNHMKIHSVQGWKNKPFGKRKHWASSEEGRKELSIIQKIRFEKMPQILKTEFGKKISESIKNKGGRKGNKNSMFGKTQSEESKLKNRLSHIGKNKGIKPWNAGKNKYNDPRIMKISLKKIGLPSPKKGKIGIYKMSEEAKNKLRETFTGRFVSEYTKKKLSVNKIKYWKDKKEKGKIVTCPICNIKFIALSSHMKYKHNITLSEFKQNHYNHKIVSIEFSGYEDVFNINVDKFHNYAVSAGVVIKNCYNKDENLIKYMSDPTTDMHRDMAIQIFMLDEFDKKSPEHELLRQAAKNGFVFPQFYGDYYKNCAENLVCNWGKLPQTRWKPGQGVPMPEGTLSDHLINKGLRSFDSFTEHVKKIEKDFWGNRFAEYAQWKETWWNLYRKYGYIDLLTGFRCQGVMNKKQACNFPAQGTAFHCLLWSLIEFDKVIEKEHLDTRIIGQVHDSGVFDVCPDELEFVITTIKEITTKKLPEHWKWIIVPMNVDMEICEIDQPWSEKKKFL